MRLDLHSINQGPLQSPEVATTVLNLVYPPSFPSLTASLPQRVTEAARSSCKGPGVLYPYPSSTAPLAATSDQTAANKPPSNPKFHTPGGQRRRPKGVNGHNTGSDLGRERPGRPTRGLENSKTSGKGATGVLGSASTQGSPQASHNPSPCVDFLTHKLEAGSGGEGESWTTCS